MVAGSATSEPRPDEAYPGGVSPRDAFPGYDEPVNIDMEPEDAMRVLLGGGVTEEGPVETEGDEATE